MKTVGMWTLVAALVLCFAGIGQVLAQEPPPAQERPRQRTRQRRTPEQMRQWREQMQQRMQEAMRERLGASKEEWQILGPMIEKVQTLQRQSRSARFMGMFGGRRDRGRFGRRREGDQQPEPAAQPQAPPERVLSETQKKAEALRKLLAAEKPDAAAIKTALAELRAAREKARQAVVAAQKQLQGIVTVPQEAQLVMMGILE